MNNTECTLNDGPGGAILIDCSSGASGWYGVAADLGTALSPLVALFVAFGSLILTLLAKREANSKQALVDKADKRRQAERISCWLEVQQDYPQTRIVLHNASDQPIWEAFIQSSYLGSSKVAQVPVLAPGAKREIEIAGEPTGQTLEQAVSVRFRDNAGRSWYRPAGAPGKLILEDDNVFHSGEESPIKASKLQGVASGGNTND